MRTTTRSTCPCWLRASRSGRATTMSDRSADPIADRQKLMISEAIVVACACDLMAYQNPYDRGSPAGKSWRELSSAVRSMKRYKRKVFKR